MKKIAIIVISLSALAVSSSAMASGSGGASRGGGFGGFSSSSQPRDPYAAAYSKGKRMFRKRITCKKCAYSGGISDGKTATEVSKRVRAGEFKLKNDQRAALLFYLSERYSIRG